MHLLATGGTGGIETLCKDFFGYSKHENTFVFVWGKDGKTYLDMKAENADVVQLNVDGKNPLQIIRQIEKIRERCKADTVVAHHASPIFYCYLIMLKWKHCAVRTLIYAHGNAVDMARIHAKGYWLRRLILQTCVKSADCVIAISQSVKKSLIEVVRAKEEKIRVIYNGVDLKRIVPDRAAVRAGEIRLMYVGRLIREKGVQVTLEGLSKLHTPHTWHFSVVGDGPYRTELEALAEQYHLTEKVSFLGTRSDVCDLLNSADVFVHMPIWEEGFGIAVVEAMASGMICVCAQSGALPEIICDSENGFLVSKQDCEALRRRLAEVIDMVAEQKTEKIRSNAIESAGQYSMERFVAALDDVLEDKGVTRTL